MRVPKEFSGALFIKKVWNGSFIIHHKDEYFRTKEIQFYFCTEREAISAFRDEYNLKNKKLDRCYL